MTAGPGFLQAGEGVAEGQGPNASLEQGDVGRMAALQGQLKPFAPGAYQAAQPPGQDQQQQGAQPGGPQPQGGPPPSSGPVQPPPQGSLRPEDMRPGGPVFMQPQLMPRQPWMQQVVQWAGHPDAGPFTVSLGRRVQAILDQQNQQAQQSGNAEQPQP